MIRLLTRLAFASVGALLLGACGAADNDPGPGGVSVGEARALDEAAEMLDQQRLPAEALAEPDAGESEAETESESAAAQ